MLDGKAPTCNLLDGAAVSFCKKNHPLCHPTGGLDTKRWKYGSAPYPGRTLTSTHPARVRPKPHTKEVVPQVEVGFDPHVGLTQGYERCNTQDPRRRQMMHPQAMELQQRTEESVRRHTKSSLIKCRARHNISRPRTGKARSTGT
jgi:hypothetical protein